MKAVAYKATGPIDREDALMDITLDTPQAGGRDLLVKVHAVSVNPVDTKVRQRQEPEACGWVVLGYDAAGVVEAVGPGVENFKVGDAVFYAGAINRPGSNSEYHLVDERLVGRKPDSLSDAEAAALPLTAITAWEMLFERLDVKRPTAQGGDIILLVGGAGGVGSIAIQLLRALTDITIIGLGAPVRRPSCCRSSPAIGSTGRGAGSGCPRVCFLNHANRYALCRYHRVDRAAGPLRPDR